MKVQVYGQAWEGMPASIIGDREGLRAVMQAIRDVLEGEPPQNVVLKAYDGETYSLRVAIEADARPMHYTCRTWRPEGEEKA